MRLRLYVQKLLTMLYGKFRGVEKKVLFNSFGGKQYSDNPRAISEKLHELFPEFEIVWRINDVDKQCGIVPDYVRVVSNGSSFIRELATCMCYVTNGELSENIYKRKGQFFVQTWHGDRIFKKILYSAQEVDGVSIPILDEFLTDLCVAGSEKGVEMFRKAFRYNGRVLTCGCPRNDKLLINSQDEVIQIKRRLNIDLKKHVFLYAPTYRDNLNNYQSSSVDLQRVLSILEETGDEWLCLIRAHPNSLGISFNYDDRFINVSTYPDMADLLLISNMLITDYSSSSTDYVITGRPIILAAFDKEEYVETCRNFEIDISEPGFIIAANQEELERIIRNTTIDEYRHSDIRVMDFYRTNETGHASEKVCVEIEKFFQNNQAKIK